MEKAGVISGKRFHRKNIERKNAEILYINMKEIRKISLVRFLALVSINEKIFEIMSTKTHMLYKFIIGTNAFP